MSMVAVFAQLNGRSEYLIAQRGSYEASPVFWAEIETAIAFGADVYVGTAPTGADRTVSVHDPETLVAVVCAIPELERVDVRRSDPDTAPEPTLEAGSVY